MLVARSYDSDYLNQIANHPEVLPWISGGHRSLDLTPLVEDHKNILLQVPYGAFLLIRKRPGWYEVHSQFLPEGWGTALEAARAALRWMFIQARASEITTQVPEANPAARLLTERAGFTHIGRAGTFPIGGKDSPLDHYRITYSQWLNKTCP